MLYLADTNILLRLAEPRHPMHAAAQNAINALVTNNNGVCAIPQNIIEFCNVATRHADQNGLGFTHQQTLAETHLLTFNRDDFKRFTGIVAVSPSELTALP